MPDTGSVSRCQRATVGIHFAQKFQGESVDFGGSLDSYKEVLQDFLEIEKEKRTVLVHEHEWGTEKGAVSR